MEYKILKLLLLLALCSNSNGFGLLLSKNVMRTTLQNSDGTYNCVCLMNNRNHPFIANVLGSERFKRLAIYLYQDQYTSKLKMYIPGIEKQLMIPDFELEPDDKLGDVPPYFRIHDLLPHFADIPIFNVKLGIHEYVPQPDVIKRPGAPKRLNRKWIMTGTIHGGEEPGVSTSLLDIYADIMNLGYDKIRNSNIIDLSVFENWFHHNLGHLLMDTDANTLKNYLLQLLLKSGVDITGQFVAQGTKRSPLNLGNIMTYYAVIDNALLLNDTNNERVNFPNPDLEVLVVSTRNPVRILGYIPIESSITKQLKIYYTNLQEKGSDCNNDQCAKMSFQKNIQMTINRNSEQNGETEPKTIPGTDGGTRKFLRNDRIVKGVFQNKAFNLQDNSVKYVINRADEGDSKEDIVTSDEEKPGVRIVGGSAATGSGTPVSSRGRSGAQGQH